MKKIPETNKKNTVLFNPNCANNDSFTHNEDTDYSTIVELIHRILIDTEGGAI